MVPALFPAACGQICDDARGNGIQGRSLKHIGKRAIVVSIIARETGNIIGVVGR